MARPSNETPDFADRVARLPWLGLGISTEFGAAAQGLDSLALAHERPDLIEFLEVGADLERGVDDTTRAWVADGRPTTYHFLDVNLEESEDVSEEWCRDTAELAGRIGARWLCGDAGLWHVGARDLGHGTLVPPVLEPESATEMATSVRRMRKWTGMEVVPENPPAHVFVGRMHLADYYANVAEQADCGLLIDVSHLAIYQLVHGYDALHAIECLPADRIVEMHLAGGRRFEFKQRTFVDDDHGCDILDESWALLDALLPRAVNLKAVVLECERNSREQVLPMFERLRARLDRSFPGCSDISTRNPA